MRIPKKYDFFKNTNILWKLKNFCDETIFKKWKLGKIKKNEYFVRMKNFVEIQNLIKTNNFVTFKSFVKIHFVMKYFWNEDKKFDILYQNGRYCKKNKNKNFVRMNFPKKNYEFVKIELFRKFTLKIFLKSLI